MVEPNPLPGSMLMIWHFFLLHDCPLIFSHPTKFLKICQFLVTLNPGQPFQFPFQFKRSKYLKWHDLSFFWSQEFPPCDPVGQTKLIEQQCIEVIKDNIEHYSNIHAARDNKYPILLHRYSNALVFPETKVSYRENSQSTNRK